MNVHQSKRAGFSLLEAVVVIGVLVIIAGMLIPMVNRAQEAERRFKTQEELLAIQVALDNYFYDNAAFPGSLSLSTFYGPYLFKGLDDEDIGDDFSPGNNYQYYNSAPKPIYAQVWSVGPDGTNDTTGGSSFSDDDYGVYSYSEIPGRRRTRVKMQIIAAAFAKFLYDPVVGSHSLSGTWATDYAAMFLMSEYANDGWGNAFLSTTVTTKAMIYSTGPDTTDNSGSSASDDVTF